MVDTAAAFSNASGGAGADKTMKPTPIPRSSATCSATSASVSATAPRRSGSPATRRALLPDAATVTTRTLSVAFQSPTYSLDTSKARSVVAFSTEKRKSSASLASARAKVSETGQNTYRWPVSGHDAGAVAMTKLHYSAAASNRKQGTLAAVRSTAHDGAPRRASVDGGNEYLRALSSSEDTDSASSGGSSRDAGADKPPVGCIAPGPRASPRSAFMSSSARFSQDAMGTRSDRYAYPVSSRTPAAALVASPSPVKKRSSLFNGLLSSPFSKKLSLTKQQQQQQSPTSKPLGSSFRMTESPSRARLSLDLPGFAGKLQQSKACSFYGDTKKVRTQKVEEEHQLRILYTRHLQWRHANAKAAAALSSQTAAAEKTLYGACVTILRMRKSVAIAKLQLQLLRNKYKLMEILRGQMMYLEEWSLLEMVYSNSLSGTEQALNATVVRIPVSDGAMADMQALKNAVGSAVDVMQSIAISTSTQLSKLAQANVLVSRLSGVAIQEFVLMARCRELLSTLASMHVKHCSLQGQRMQLNQRRLRRFQ